MSNYKIKIDLLKVRGAVLLDINGKTKTKKCIVIPIEDSDLYAGSKGVYLSLSAFELKEPKFEDTHCLKVEMNSDLYKSLSDEQKKAIPIVGGMHEQIPTNDSGVLKTAKAMDFSTSDKDEDLPF